MTVTVAVVEDSEDQVRMLEAFLEYEGFVVRDYSDDWENQDWSDVDVAVVDLYLGPALGAETETGESVARWLAENAKWVRRILTTGVPLTYANIDRECWDDMLAKPFNPADLASLCGRGRTSRGG